MVQRSKSQRTVLNVAKPQGSEPEMFGTLASVAGGFENIAGKFQEMKDLAVMNDAMAEGNLQMADATNKFRIENEQNPNDPKALSNLDKQYREIFGGYDNNVSMVGRGKWSQISKKVIGQQKMDNIKWGVKQGIVNAETNINNAIKKEYILAKIRGEAGDIGKAFEDFEDSFALLKSVGLKTVGATKARKLLEEYESGFMKSFLIGAISKDPEEGLDFLNDDRIKNSITDTKDIGILVDYAKARIEGNKQIDNANDWASQREFDDKVAKGTLNFEGDVIPRWEEGKLSTKSLKKYTKLAGGEDPISIETDYVVYNKLMKEILDPDNEDLEKSYIKLNDAFLGGKLSTPDYKMLVGDISPNYYEAKNKNKKMNATPVERMKLEAVDFFTTAKEDYAWHDDDLARMSRDFHTYITDNPRATTREMKRKTKEIQGDMIKSKYTNIQWTPEKKMYNIEGEKVYCSVDKDGNPIIEAVPDEI